MVRETPGFTAVVAVACVLSLGGAASTQSQSTNLAALYQGARVITGDGRAPIASADLLVENGIISRIGNTGTLNAPRTASRVDLSGKTIMPALVNAHGHPGFQRGLTYSAPNFTRDTIVDDLNRALYFGVAAVQSQGIEKGDVTYRVRADQQTHEARVGDGGI